MKTSLASMLLAYWWVLPAILFIMMYKWTFRLFGAVIVPQDCIAIVEKKFVLFGKYKTLPDGAIIALNGEAGVQADTLAPGLHWLYWPWQFSITLQKFITIGRGKVGLVESRGGQPMPAGRILARKVESNTFQNARVFLTGGGERGTQAAIIPPGTYRINTALFTVVEADAIEIPDNMVGVVTTSDGQPLNSRNGDIAGKVIEGHNMFQDADAFIASGGFRGLQEQVMLAGRYYLNPKFVTIDTKPMTDVPIAHVGVIIAYVGEEGVDVSGETFKHGNLVSKGEKGVWSEPLDPGKYPINPFTHRVELVPTANVVLNWANDKTEAHKLDERLSSITVRSSDGFTYNLDVSQIIHIPRNDAPKVIARFGNVAALVTQVLEPTIGNYFRNAAQGSDAIDFLKNRVARQGEARASIAEALQEYNVGAVNTLIGDIVPPAALMKTLTDRKIAQQEQITFGTQKEAETVRKTFEQAKAQADTQASVVTAERAVEIAEFNANARIKTAEGEAKSKTINAAADAEVTRVNGEAKAAVTTSVGSAEATVIRLKVDSFGAGNYAVIEVANALSKSGFKLVPEIVAGGESGQGGGLVNALLGSMLNDALASKRANTSVGTEAPASKPVAKDAVSAT